MSQFLKTAINACAAFLAMSVSAMAQDGSGAASLSGVGAGIVVIGAGLGIGKLASAAFESMARQPEVANDIKGAMIIVAAMVEGAAVIGLIVCMIK
ncbi:MAG: ATP synthase F0 subunit C [Fuerstiella sp.]|nr:ATP synthase F0 subunit C [Fuerstiella sp.]